VAVLDASSAVHTLWNALPEEVQKRLQDGNPQFPLVLHADPDAEAHAVPLEGCDVPGFAGVVYGEPAFEYLVDVERRRAESTQHPFLLMLIECDDPDAGRLFPIVSACVRETDFVGWYRQGAVVGAALTQDGRRGTEQAGGVVRERLAAVLRNELPAEFVSKLRIHLYEVFGNDELRVD
jgi:hypothetical protein